MDENLDQIYFAPFLIISYQSLRSFLLISNRIDCMSKFSSLLIKRKPIKSKNSQSEMFDKLSLESYKNQSLSQSEFAILCLCQSSIILRYLGS